MQWRIQDFPQGGAPTPKIAIIFHIFAENCMKMKEFGPPGGARVPGAPPWIRQWDGSHIHSFPALPIEKALSQELGERKVHTRIFFEMHQAGNIGIEDLRRG